MNPQPELPQSASHAYLGQELEIFAHAQNWKRYWAAALLPYVRNDVLEVGAGLGANTRLLLSSQPTRIRRWVCLEPDPRLLEQLRRLALGQISEPMNCSTPFSILTFSNTLRTTSVRSSARLHTSARADISSCSPPRTSGSSRNSTPPSAIIDVTRANHSRPWRKALGRCVLKGSGIWIAAVSLPLPPIGCSCGSLRRHCGKFTSGTAF